MRRTKGTGLGVLCGASMGGWRVRVGEELLGRLAISLDHGLPCFTTDFIPAVLYIVAKISLKGKIYNELREKNMKNLLYHDCSYSKINLYLPNLLHSQKECSGTVPQDGKH